MTDKHALFEGWARDFSWPFPCNLSRDENGVYEDDNAHKMFIGFCAGLAAAAPVAAPDGWKRCPHCGTHEVELDRTCHNSSCSAYAQAESVYRGWEIPKPR